MFMIDPFEFASEWLQNTATILVSQLPGMADAPRKPEIVAVAFFRIYDEGAAERHPMLRDRTEEVRKMLGGLAGDLNPDPEIVSFTKTGSEFKAVEGEFDPVGAAFVQTFCLMAVYR